jgi:MoxR-like ATPase
MKYPPAMTDGWKIYYNPSFISSQDEVFAEAVILHELMHIIRKDIQVMKQLNLQPQLWNIATDKIINQEIIDEYDGNKIPLLVQIHQSNITYIEQLIQKLITDMDEYEIYAELNQKQDDNNGGGNGGENDSNQDNSNNPNNNNNNNNNNNDNNNNNNNNNQKQENNQNNNNNQCDKSNNNQNNQNDNNNQDNNQNNTCDKCNNNKQNSNNNNKPNTFDELKETNDNEEELTETEKEYRRKLNEAIEEYKRLKPQEQAKRRGDGNITEKLILNKVQEKVKVNLRKIAKEIEKKSLYENPIKRKINGIIEFPTKYEKPDVIIVLDVSGSMTTKIKENITPLDIAQIVVKEIDKQFNIIKIYTGNEALVEIRKTINFKQLEVGGGTNMKQVLKQIEEQKKIKGQNIILITDAEDDLENVQAQNKVYGVFITEKEPKTNLPYTRVYLEFLDLQKLSKSMEIINLKELKELIKEYILDNDTLIIWGYYGVGKTQIIRQIAKELQIELIEINIPIMNEEDIKGIRVYSEKRDEILAKVFGPLSKINPNKKTLIYLDEINRTKNKEILNALLRIILEKELPFIELTPEQKQNITFILTANPEDENVYELDTALLNRMGQVFLMPTPEIANDDEWINYISNKHQIKAEILRKLLKGVVLIFDDEFKVNTTPRNLEKVIEIIVKNNFKLNEIQKRRIKTRINKTSAEIILNNLAKIIDNLEDLNEKMLKKFYNELFNFNQLSLQEKRVLVEVIQNELLTITEENVSKFENVLERIGELIEAHQENKIILHQALIPIWNKLEPIRKKALEAKEFSIKAFEVLIDIKDLLNNLHFGIYNTSKELYYTDDLLKAYEFELIEVRDDDYLYNITLEHNFNTKISEIVVNFEKGKWYKKTNFIPIEIFRKHPWVFSFKENILKYFNYLKTSEQVKKLMEPLDKERKEFVKIIEFLASKIDCFYINLHKNNLDKNIIKITQNEHQGYFNIVIAYRKYKAIIELPKEAKFLKKTIPLVGEFEDINQLENRINNPKNKINLTFIDKEVLMFIGGRYNNIEEIKTRLNKRNTKVNLDYIDKTMLMFLNISQTLIEKFGFRFNRNERKIQGYWITYISDIYQNITIIEITYKKKVYIKKENKIFDKALKYITKITPKGFINSSLKEYEKQIIEELKEFKVINNYKLEMAKIVYDIYNYIKPEIASVWIHENIENNFETKIKIFAQMINPKNIKLTIHKDYYTAELTLYKEKLFKEVLIFAGEYQNTEEIKTKLNENNPKIDLRYINKEVLYFIAHSEYIKTNRIRWYLENKDYEEFQEWLKYSGYLLPEDYEDEENFELATRQYIGVVSDEIRETIIPLASLLEDADIDLRFQNKILDKNINIIYQSENTIVFEIKVYGYSFEVDIYSPAGITKIAKVLRKFEKLNLRYDKFIDKLDKEIEKVKTKILNEIFKDFEIKQAKHPEMKVNVIYYFDENKTKIEIQKLNIIYTKYINGLSKLILERASLSDIAIYFSRDYQYIDELNELVEKAFEVIEDKEVFEIIDLIRDIYNFYKISFFFFEIKEDSNDKIEVRFDIEENDIIDDEIIIKLTTRKYATKMDYDKRNFKTSILGLAGVYNNLDEVFDKLNEVKTNKKIKVNLEYISKNFLEFKIVYNLNEKEINKRLLLEVFSSYGSVLLEIKDNEIIYEYGEDEMIDDFYFEVEEIKPIHIEIFNLIKQLIKILNIQKAYIEIEKCYYNSPNPSIHIKRYKENSVFMILYCDYYKISIAPIQLKSKEIYLKTIVLAYRYKDLNELKERLNKIKQNNFQQLNFNPQFVDKVLLT